MLHLLAASPARLSLAEVAGSLDLAKGTAHGLLRTLVDVGFVDQDSASGRYELGAGFGRLGRQMLDENELRARAMNWCDPLASRTGESVRIATLRGAEAVVVHHVFRPDDTPQKLEIGARYPLHASAVGKALLAYTPALVRSLTYPLPGYTPRTLCRRDAVETELAGVRGAQLAVSREEYRMGVASIAAPIRGPGGLVVGAIGLVGEVERICNTDGSGRPALVAQVRETAEHVSRELDADHR